MVYNNDKLLLLFQNAVATFVVIITFCFSFSAGVGWRGWGGGVLRQVQGLVSNTPFFFSAPPLLCLTAGLPLFQTYFQHTHSMVSIVLQVWKALYIEPESLHIYFPFLCDYFLSWYFSPAFVIAVIYSAGTHFMCLPRRQSDCGWTTKRLLQMRSKLHFEYINLTKRLAHKYGLTTLTDLRNKVVSLKSQQVFRFCLWSVKFHRQWNINFNVKFILFTSRSIFLLFWPAQLKWEQLIAYGSSCMATAAWQH